MACPTCGVTMQNLGLDPAGGRRTWHCPRCGTTRSTCWVGADVYTEDTVPRWTRLLISQAPGYDDDLDKELAVTRRQLQEQTTERERKETECSSSSESGRLDGP